MGMKIGFTGTAKGMWPEQLREVEKILETLRVSGAKEVHHGMCVGADAQFHGLAKRCGFTTVGHPGVDGNGNAPKRDPFARCDFTCNAAPYLTRNKHLVGIADVLIAAPYELYEVVRSGTWATVREARRRGVRLVIVQPNGEVIHEGGWDE